MNSKTVIVTKMFLVLVMLSNVSLQASIIMLNKRADERVGFQYQTNLTSMNFATLSTSVLILQQDSSGYEISY